MPTKTEEAPVLLNPGVDIHDSNGQQVDVEAKENLDIASSESVSALEEAALQDIQFEK
jgi:hypothetical protein